MHLLAWNYAHMNRLTESMALHEKVLELHRTMEAPDQEPPVWWMETFTETCLWAGELDRADRLLRTVIEHDRKLTLPHLTGPRWCRGSQPPVTTVLERSASCGMRGLWPFASRG